MKINIIRINYSGAGIVERMNKLIGTSTEVDLVEVQNPKFYNKDEINIVVYDYTPVRQGNILIKLPGSTWEKLKMNSKIFNKLKKLVDYREPHTLRKSNWLASFQKTELNSVIITL